MRLKVSHTSYPVRAFVMSAIALWACNCASPASAQNADYAPVAPTPSGVTRLETQNGQLLLPRLTSDPYQFDAEEEIRNLDLLLSRADDSGTFADIGDMRFFLYDIRSYRESLANRLKREQSLSSKAYGSDTGSDGGTGTQGVTGFEYQRRTSGPMA